MYILGCVGDGSRVDLVKHHEQGGGGGGEGVDEEAGGGGGEGVDEEGGTLPPSLPRTFHTNRLLSGKFLSLSLSLSLSIFLSLYLYLSISFSFFLYILTFWSTMQSTFKSIDFKKYIFRSA